MSDIAALLLAAGQGTRFGLSPGETKLAMALNGRPLIRYVAEAALASRAHPVGVVTGHAAETVSALLEGLGFQLIYNGAYADGLASSLRAGVAALPGHIDGVVILLADMPFVTKDVIDTLISRFEAAVPKPDAVVPVRNGRHGNPVLLGKRLFEAIAKLEGDRGAWQLLQRPGVQIVECVILDEAIAIDIDTREKLEQFEGRPVAGLPSRQA
jgi:molybdenum cofactor cytidylyltransferase